MMGMIQWILACTDHPYQLANASASGLRKGHQLNSQHANGDEKGAKNEYWDTELRLAPSMFLNQLRQELIR